MFAAIGGYLNVVKILYKVEAGILNQDGWSALMIAALNGYFKIAKLLFNSEVTI